jgi:ATP-dependent DNA ligase
VTPPPLAQRIALGLMHATQVATPFHRPGWVYEEKVDGYRMAAMKADRMAAMKAGDATRLISRTGIQHTKRFPELVRPLISRFEWLRGRQGRACHPAGVHGV